MKRSEVNNAIRYTLNTLGKNHLRLPAFAYWTMDEWRRMDSELDNIKKIGLGWDVTDFGSGDFAHVGSVLFTVRNGCLADSFEAEPVASAPDSAAFAPALIAGTPYAEKIILQRHETEQEIPFHFHRVKTEDIINRGGGLLMLELYNSTPDGGLDKNSDIKVMMDGIVRTLPAGTIVEVEKGCSITLQPLLHHRFWAKKGAGDLIIGEISSINDDKTDNVFLEASRRFSIIEEDELATVPLCGEYACLYNSQEQWYH